MFQPNMAHVEEQTVLFLLLFLNHNPNVVSFTLHYLLNTPTGSSWCQFIGIFTVKQSITEKTESPFHLCELSYFV